MSDSYIDIEKWDRRYLGLAYYVSNWSKDPSTKVGAVITRDNRVVSLGFNGFPEGVNDGIDRYENRDLKYKMIVHAEPNAIISAKQDLTNCWIYLWPFLSCSSCTGLIIQSGIKRVIAPENDNPRWAESFEISKTMFREANVEVKFYKFNFEME